MTHLLPQPVMQAPANTTIEGIGQPAEDYLDWVENHAPVGGASGAFATALIGIAVTLTAVTVAAIAFVGF